MNIPVNSLFHLAICVNDLRVSKYFYGQILKLKQGRETDSWVDFDFFGHQLSLHLGQPFSTENCGKVGTHKVPMPHFGAVLLEKEWEILAARLENHVEWIIAPTTRFKGSAGEQKIMFFKDPSGNPIEIKGFKSWDEVYAI